MKVIKNIHSLFPAGGKIPVVPIVAVVVDCLIVGAFLSPLILPDNEKPIASAQKPTAKGASAPAGTSQRVLGQNTATAQQPTPTTGAITTIAAASQTNPIVDPQLGLIPQVTDPQPAPSAPTTTEPPIAAQPGPAATTPPTTTPEPMPSFTTAIIQPGQVAAGTQIGFNATTGEKTFYGGDLALSLTSITISRSGLLAQTNVTVATPDNTIVATPVSTGGPSLVTDILLAITSSTFTMFIDPATATANGSYTLNLTTTRAGATAGETWQYNGFLTVSVID